MKINELATLAGITVRTLRHYDAIGLLPPARIDSNGYRIYDETNLERLQQILFFKELDFSLSEIQGILNDPLFDKVLALEAQKKLLIQKRNRLNRLISLCDSRLKGDLTMSFKPFDMSDIAQTKQETKEKFGHTKAYAQSVAKTKDYTATDWERINAGMHAIFSQFAACRDESVTSPQVQALVKNWQDYISTHFYTCSLEILEGLALMYTQDERFTQTIDQAGEGTARFIADAIQAYCQPSS